MSGKIHRYWPVVPSGLEEVAPEELSEGRLQIRGATSCEGMHRRKSSSPLGAFRKNWRVSQVMQQVSVVWMYCCRTGMHIAIC